MYRVPVYPFEERSVHVIPVPGYEAALPASRLRIGAVEVVEAAVGVMVGVLVGVADGVAVGVDVDVSVGVDVGV